MKAKETVPFTKPMGGDDVRKNHPGGAGDRAHPHQGAGYGKFGPSKQGGDDARKVSPADKSIRKHPHQGR
jgi:hypothetical protein